MLLVKYISASLQSGYLINKVSLLQVEGKAVEHQQPPPERCLALIVRITVESRDKRISSQSKAESSCTED